MRQVERIAPMISFKFNGVKVAPGIPLLPFRRSSSFRQLPRSRDAARREDDARTTRSCGFRRLSRCQGMHNLLPGMRRATSGVPGGEAAMRLSGWRLGPRLRVEGMASERMDPGTRQLHLEVMDGRHGVCSGFAAALPHRILYYTPIACLLQRPEE